MKPDSELIDLRRLPTQTDAAYWVIVLVILGTALAGTIGGSPILMWPITLTLLALPIRAVLALPEQEMRHVDQTATAELSQEGTLNGLHTVIQSLAQEHGFTGPIHLLIDRNPSTARAFGTWRRHYILLGVPLARKLYADWQTSEHQAKARALLLHEIAHLLHKDVQRISYTRALLRSTFLVTGWWALFLIGWLTLSQLLLPVLLDLDFTALTQVDPVTVALVERFTALSEAEKVELSDKLESINFSLVIGYIANAFVPLVAMGAVLWLFYWRRMLRLQEFYADQLAWAGTQNVQKVVAAFGRYPQWFRAKPSPPKTRLTRLRALTTQMFQFTPHTTWDNQPPTWPRWFSLHPTYQERYQCLTAPHTLTQQWINPTVAIAVLVVALEVLLVSPLASYHFSSFPIHFVSIMTFVLVSTWWAPLLITGQPYRSALSKMLLCIYGLRTGWLLINVSLLVIGWYLAPELLLAALNLIVFTAGRYAGTPPLELPLPSLAGMLNWVPSFVGLQIAGPVTVLLALSLYYVVHRHFIARNQVDVNWPRRHWRNVAAIATITATLVLNPLTALINSEWARLLSTGFLIGYGMGLAALIFLGWQMFRPESPL